MISKGANLDCLLSKHERLTVQMELPNGTVFVRAVKEQSFAVTTFCPVLRKAVDVMKRKTATTERTIFMEGRTLGFMVSGVECGNGVITRNAILLSITVGVGLRYVKNGLRFHLFGIGRFRMDILTNCRLTVST